MADRRRSRNIISGRFPHPAAKRQIYELHRIRTTVQKYMSVQEKCFRIKQKSEYSF